MARIALQPLQYGYYSLSVMYSVDTLAYLDHHHSHLLRGQIEHLQSTLPAQDGGEGSKPLQQWVCSSGAALFEDNYGRNDICYLKVFVGPAKLADLGERAPYCPRLRYHRRPCHY